MNILKAQVLSGKEIHYSSSHTYTWLCVNLSTHDSKLFSKAYSHRLLRDRGNHEEHLREPTINCDLPENTPKTQPGGWHSLAVILDYLLSLELGSSSQGYILKLIRETVFSKLDAKLDIVQVHSYLKTTMLLKYNYWQELYAITSFTSN